MKTQKYIENIFNENKTRFSIFSHFFFTGMKPFPHTNQLRLVFKFENPITFGSLIRIVSAPGATLVSREPLGMFPVP